MIRYPMAILIPLLFSGEILADVGDIIVESNVREQNWKVFAGKDAPDPGVLEKDIRQV